MTSLLSDAALEEGLRRFRQVQGVGVGGFSGIWVAVMGECVHSRAPC
jgi:hypothetical protein